MYALKKILPLAFVLAVAAGAAAQPGPQRDRYPDRDRDGYRDRGPYGRDYERRYLEPIFDARRDLDRVQDRRNLSDRDRRKIASGLRNVDRFLVNWREGRFDKDRLDGLIEDLDDLARSDRLSTRERAMFARDRDQMRAFRARGDFRRR